MSKIIFGILFLFLLLFGPIYADKIGENDKVNDDSTKVKSKSDTIKLTRRRSREDIANAQIINVDSLLLFQFKSPVFYQRPFMPAKFTCDGIDISPAINIQMHEEGLNSFALICDDPDAPGGTWVHWVIFNLPARHLILPENVDKVIYPSIGQDSTDIQPIQGINDFGKIGYGGPCPPVGREHRYYFTLYALDTVLGFDEADIQKGITKDMLLRAMEGHILSESVLMGKYKR